MIEFRNIFFGYKEEILLENFNRKIFNGEKVAICGQSGCGKTTLLNMILGFELPQKGDIYIDNDKLSHFNISKIRQKIAWLPQNFNISFETVKELFFSPFNLKSNYKNKPNEKDIEKSFYDLGLKKSILKKNINEISGGQKQRILLSSMILLKKNYILLDEPTSALDHLSVEKTSKVLLNLKHTTIIAATHDKNFINKADSVIKF